MERSSRNFYPSPRNRIFYSIFASSNRYFTENNRWVPLSDPAKNQQVYHVNEAFQESDVAGSVNQENGSDSSPNNADGSEEF